MLGAKRARVPGDETADENRPASSVIPDRHAHDAGAAEQTDGSPVYSGEGSEKRIGRILREFSELGCSFFSGASKDEVKDADRIAPKVASIRAEIEEKFGHFWHPAWRHLVVGALVCFRDRQCDVGLREHVQMLHVIEGADNLRAHNGQVFTYTDGSWNLYDGVVSEGTMARCSTYLLRLEGLFRSVGARGEIKRDESALLDAISWVLARNSGHGGANPQGTLEHFEEVCLEQGESRGPGATWVERTAKALSELKADLMKQLVERKSQLFTYYSEWCATRRLEQPGIAFSDTCFVFTEDQFRPLRIVKKSPANNIYVFIDHPLLDPVEAAHAERLRTFWATTFWGNALAMQCQFAALALALRGENVDRCFWTLGPGGVGQSLLSHFLDALLDGRHSFLDTNVYYSDEELRKQAQMLVSKLVVTAQEAVQGAAHNMREDLYKKHMTADAIASRLPYAIVTKQVELKGWKRMELNRLPTFSGITEISFDSIYRRAWVCKLSARFKSPAELASITNPAKQGIFAKDASLKAFLKSSQAIGAGLKMMVGFMSQNTKQQCHQVIEDYVERLDGGLTRERLRFACDLPGEQRPQQEFDPIAGMKDSLLKVHNDLISAVLELDKEPTRYFLCSLQTPFRERGRAKREEIFNRLMQHGYWREYQGRRQHAHGQYCAPIIQTTNTVASLFPARGSHIEETFPERFNAKRLQAYVGNANRVHNFNVMVRFFRRRLKDNEEKRGRGTQSWSAREERAALLEGIEKMEAREHAARKLLEKIQQLPPDADGNVTVYNNYDYKRDVRGRRYLAKHCFGAQKISRRLREGALIGVEDWDFENAQFAIAAHFPQLLGFKVQHPVACLPGVTSYVRGREEILRDFGPDREVAKVILLKTLNGGQIPPEFQGNGILAEIKKESKFLRWLACSLQPSVYEACCADKEKAWPEASTLTYTLEGAEDFALQALHTFVRSIGPVKHLSLEFDGVEVDSGLVNLRPDFQESAEDFVFSQTGYRLKLRKKRRQFLCELIEECATGKTSVPMPGDLLEGGNCILASVAHLQQRQEEFRVKLTQEAQRGVLTAYPTYRAVSETFGFALESCSSSSLHGWEVGSTFLLHAESKGGQPHCFGLEIGESGAVYVYDGPTKYATTIILLTNNIASAIDRSTIVLFRLGHMGTSSDILLDLRAGSTDDYLENPGEDFWASLSSEVQKYSKALSRTTPARDQLACDLCPRRRFGRVNLLRTHVKLHHTLKARYCASGAKQLRVAQALFDNDRFEGSGGSSCPRGGYLKRSAEFIVKHAGDLPDRWTDMDKMITLVLDVEGPQYWANINLQNRPALRRVGNTLYTQQFAQRIFTVALTNDAVVERAATHFCTVAQGSGEVASLLPRNPTTWENIMEDVFFSPAASAELSRLLRECEDRGEFRSISVDGTFKPCLSLLGQSKHTAPKRIRNDQALSAEEALHVVYTFRGSTGAVIAVSPHSSESTESQIVALKSNCTEAALAAIEHYATDDPSHKLLLALRQVCPGIQAMSLDPLHTAFKYEQAHFERKSPGSRFLPKVLGKFSATRGNGRASGLCGSTFYDGIAELHVGRAEKRARELLVDRTMDKREAEKLRDELDVDAPFESRAEFVLLLAALVCLWADEVNKITMSRKPVYSCLVYASTPSRIEWLLNGTRYRNRCPPKTLELLSVGTTSNEALHSEMRLWFWGVRDMHQSTLRLKLRIFQLAKLIAHNSALFYPTTVQIRQKFVLARSTQCRKLWPSEEDWEKWRSELSPAGGPGGRKGVRAGGAPRSAPFKKRAGAGRTDYQKKFLQKATNPLSATRKKLEKAVRAHKAASGKESKTAAKKRTKRTVFTLAKDRRVPTKWKN